MSLRTLNTPSGAQGGAIQLARDIGRARNIHLSIANNTNTTHLAIFGRSRREVSAQGVLAGTTQLACAGFSIPAVPNTVANSTVDGVAYTPYLLQGWLGELWACSDADGVLQVDVFDAGEPEK